MQTRSTAQELPPELPLVAAAKHSCFWYLNGLQLRGGEGAGHAIHIEGLRVDVGAAMQSASRGTKRGHRFKFAW